MVKVGWMAPNLQMVGERNAKDEAEAREWQVQRLTKDLKAKEREEPEMNLLEATGSVVLGMACVVSYTFLMAALC